MASKTTVTRLQRELQVLKDSADVFTAEPTQQDGRTNWLLWDAKIHGTDGSLYQGKVLSAKLVFPINYPMRPFEIFFTPPLLHPNVNEEGKIHIPVLKIRSDDPFDTSDIGEEWTPVQNIRTGMYSAISSLHSPNVHYAANERLADLCVSDRGAYDARVREQLEKL